MAIHVTGPSALQSKMSSDSIGAKHICADDVGAGKLQARNMRYVIHERGPPLGYYPNSTMFCVIAKEEMKELAKEIYRDTDAMMRTEGKTQEY